MLESTRFSTNEWAQVEVYGSGYSGKVKMKNLSQSGACFESSDILMRVSAGDLLRITVELGGIGKARRVSAEVIWLNKPNREKAIMGVCFLKPDEIYEKLSSRF